MSTLAQPTTNRILRLKQVEDKVGLRRSCIYQKIQRAEFPAPLHLTEYAVGWLESAIDEWIDTRLKVVGINRIGKHETLVNGSES